MRRILTYTVDPEQDGMTVKTYLKKHAGVSLRLMQQLKSTCGSILLNDFPAAGHIHLHTGDILQIYFEDKQSSNFSAMDRPVDIIFEDDDFLVVNKPAGMATHPSRAHQHDTLANALIHRFASQGETFVFRAVNRLDLETSGLMLVAKNILSASLGGRLAQTHLFREYTAVTDGLFPGKPTTFTGPIRRESEGMQKRIVSPDGVPAVTHCTRISCVNGHSVVRIRLETGRTHQIRVHLSHAGYPICGDTLYGGCSVLPRLGLHSCLLAFTHPISGKHLSFCSSVPEDMAI